MNILLHWISDIECDRKKIETLASIGYTYLLLFVFTLCFGAVTVYTLCSQVRALKSENRILKELIEQHQPPPTSEDKIRSLERLENPFDPTFKNMDAR